MTAALLAPWGLAGLAAVALPLLIHLARRAEQRFTDFAALRWLRPRPKPRRRPRLDEHLLLAARLLLLALLAVALARPVLRGGPQARRWVAVAPGVDAGAARAAVGRGAHAVWLAPGLPDLGRPPPAGAPALPSLLRELDADLPAGASLTVLVPAVIERADAERPRLSRRVEWRVAPGREAAPAAAPVPAEPPLALRYAPGREEEVRPLRAAAAAWAAPPAPARIDAGPVALALPVDARRIVWAAPGPAPGALRRLVAGGAVALLTSEVGVAGWGAPVPLWRDAAGGVLAEGGALGRGRWRRFTRPLASETTPELLQPDVPARLHELLAEPPAPPARVRAPDYAPLLGGRAGGVTAQDLGPALALAAAAAFALERVLATRRRRAEAP